MDGTDVINQALASLIDTELVAKQFEQAFKDVSKFIPIMGTYNFVYNSTSFVVVFF
jgi:hypothetical protein